MIVVNGVVRRWQPRQEASYAELIGGRYFNVQLDWNKQFGNPLYAPGKAQPKPHTAYKIVGQSFKREDVAPKVFGRRTTAPTSRYPAWCTGG